LYTRFVIGEETVFNGSSRPLLVHLVEDPDIRGNVLEEEVSSSGDQRLNQTALDLVKQHPLPRAAAQREVYITVELARAIQ
jgi:hypothetical protein